MRRIARSLRQKATDITQLPVFKGLTRKRVLLAAGGACGLLIIFYATTFFWPRDITFSYTGSSCFFNPTLLPGTLGKGSSDSFKIEAPASFNIGSVAIYSGQTCVSLTKPIKNQDAQTVSLAPFNNPLVKKIVRVTPGKLPTLAKTVLAEKPIAPQEPLTIPLTQADNLFDYRLTANAKETTCDKKGAELLCNLTELQLAQATPYKVTLARSFASQPGGTVFEQDITTVNPINLVSASIPSNQKVFSIPTDLTLTFDKPLASFDGVRLTRADGDKPEIPITAKQNGATLVVTFTTPLPRSAPFTLTVDHAKAQDGAYLPNALVQQFSTSGGPQVQSVNIGRTKTQPGSAVVLTFDSPIGPNQDLQKFAGIEVGGKRLAATVTARGNTITIAPQGLDRCSIFTVKVTDGIASDAGVTGGSAWQFGSRTVCQAALSVGTSVQGRAITAYKYGNGPSKIIFVGTLHGDETSATNTLTPFMSALETSFENIPANRSIIVIPNANPDGYAANTRTNSRGQDLNRNFPTNNWKQGIHTQFNGYQPNGGGTAPLSEPESAALAGFINAQGARLVLSYHAVAGIVAANEAGDSLAMARLYGEKSGLRSYGNDASTVFDYDTTGAFEDWLADRRGIPGLLIELATKTSNEYNSHKNAMWAMVALP